MMVSFALWLMCGLSQNSIHITHKLKQHPHLSSTLQETPMAITNQLLHLQCTQTPTPNFSPSSQFHPSIASLLISNRTPSSNKPHIISKHRCASSMKPKASSNSDGIVPADDEDGVSLGTMKLAANTDIARFETLLFQVMIKMVHFVALSFFSTKDWMCNFGGACDSGLIVCVKEPICHFQSL